MQAKRTAFLTVSLIAMLAIGCATQKTRVVYDKPGVTLEQRQRDESYCVGVAAADTKSSWVPAWGATDRGTYEACMKSLGYTVAESTSIQR